MHTFTLDRAALEHIRTKLRATVSPLADAVEQLRGHAPAERIEHAWTEFVDDIAGWVHATEAAISSVETIGRVIEEEDAAVARTLDELA